MAQANVSSIDVVICHEVTSLVSCTLDELAQRVPAYSWAQVFASVDRLSRQGTLTLSHARCFGYVVSMGPDAPPPTSLHDRKSQALFGRPGCFNPSQKVDIQELGKNIVRGVRLRAVAERAIG